MHSPLPPLVKFLPLGALAALLGSPAMLAAAPAPDTLANISMDVEVKRGKPEVTIDKKKATKTTAADISYAVTLRNSSPIPAPNVTIEYAVYNRTTVNDLKEGRSTWVETITGTEAVELAPNQKKTVETQKVPNVDVDPSSRTKVSTTSQAVAGWWIQAKIGNKVVAFKESQVGIKKKMEAEAKEDKGK